MTDVTRYLHEQTTNAQAKYGYFLLAAAAGPLNAAGSSQLV